MRRSGVGLADVASFDTLSRALWRAARGKRQRPEVAAFAENVDVELSTLSTEILAGTVELGRVRSFEIRDPKRRMIHAPCFRERVVHHALMEHVGPVLERSLVADTFACRVGKGTLAAVHRAQHHLRRYPWTVKVDMRAYFASIDHCVLRAALRRKLKDRGLLNLCDRTIASHHASQRRGLPIGALSSQHFANLYLGPLDRFLLEELKVPGMVRYMDDTIAWCQSRERAREVLQEIELFVSNSLHLELKPAQIQRSTLGISFLGFRILPGVLRLSRRRRRRYTAARRRIEAAYAAGATDALTLQAGASAALAITAHADARAWRRAELGLHPPLDV